MKRKPRTMRPGTPDVFTIMEVSRIIGASYTYTWHLTKDKRKNRRLPVRYHQLTGKPYVHRTDLIAFLKFHGFPAEMYRPHFQPPKGRILTCGLDYKLAAEISPLDATHCRSQVQLGVNLAYEPCWAVLLDFLGIGRDAAMAAARELREWRDYPLLIGLAGDDEPIRTGDAANLFDLVVGRPVQGWRLRKSLVHLRRSVVGAAPRVAERRGGFILTGQDQEK